MRIKFDKEHFVVEKKNCATKIVNAYIVYEIDTWSKAALNSVKLKISCLVQLI